MSTSQRRESIQALDQPIQHALDTQRVINPGQGYRWEPLPGDSTRVGRDQDGTSDAEVAWRRMEADGDDPESRTCWCQLSGPMPQHRHRMACRAKETDDA